MSNTYITIVDGEYKKAKAPDVPQPWKPTMPEAPSGGGLPDPSSYADGTVLIKVGDEWKAQSGYGYESAGAFETIEWDGNTDGKHTIAVDEGMLLCKVSDVPIQPSALVGSEIVAWVLDVEDYEHITVTAEDIVEMGNNLYSLTDANIIFVAMEDTDLEGIAFEKGVYFMKANEVSDDDYHVVSLTAPSSVTTIDPKFIPQSGIPEAKMFHIVGDRHDGEYTYYFDEQYEENDFSHLIDALRAHVIVTIDLHRGGERYFLPVARYVAVASGGFVDGGIILPDDELSDNTPIYATLIHIERDSISVGQTPILATTE